MYKPTPDGLGGNDDTGQMSAWYIFSTLGFYPVAPASNDYAIGSPAINNAVIQVGGGKTFTITVKNQSEKNVYIQKILLNGKPLTGLTITHQEIMAGGELVFFMGSKHKYFFNNSFAQNYICVRCRHSLKQARPYWCCYVQQH
jgi:putative alpha-1,2-mannosidase